MKLFDRYIDIYHLQTLNAPWNNTAEDIISLQMPVQVDKNDELYLIR